MIDLGLPPVMAGLGLIVMLAIVLLVLRVFFRARKTDHAEGKTGVPSDIGPTVGASEPLPSDADPPTNDAAKVRAGAPEFASEIVVEPPTDPSETIDPGSASSPDITVPVDRPIGTADQVVLALRRIDDGEALLADGDIDAARTEFLAALTLGQSASDPEAQALARLNLGDIAHREDDLTSACEHWQLARDLFASAQRRDAQAQVEERMSKTQCPTDWVLTDF